MLRFIIAFAACWHVYLMILSCFQAWKHVTVAAVECSAAQGTSWWLSSASATTKSSTMHGAMPDCFGSAARARVVICRMLANYSRTGVSREGQTDVHTSIFSAGDGNFRQGMEIITKAGHSSETEGTLKKGARSEQLTWNIFARHWCISEPGSTNMGKDDKRREDGGWG